MLAFAIFRESRKENFGLEEIGKCLKKARAESEAGKNGEEEEKRGLQEPYRRADRNGGGKKTGSLENGYRKRRAGIWGMDEGEKDRKILLQGVCGSDHGRGGERDRVLKTVAIAVGILMAVLPAAAAALLESMACFSINGSWGLQRWSFGSGSVSVVGGEGRNWEKERRIPGGRRSVVQRGGGPGKRQNHGRYILGKRRRMRGEFPAGLAAEQREEKEEEFQTILLAARPLEIESRKLTAFSGNLRSSDIFSIPDREKPGNGRFFVRMSRASAGFM